LPDAVGDAALAKAERAHRDTPLSRTAVKQLLDLLLIRGELGRAQDLADTWSAKDPLDPEALTARADIAAARGDRALAIRILGSAVDMRPDDHKAQWRLARLHRWSGDAARGCRFSMAVAQIRREDPKLLAEAVRCARDTGQNDWERALLDSVEPNVRTQAETLLSQGVPDPDALRGDLKVEASWTGAQDLDLALLHPDGHPVSWLGAPTRSVISARDVLSTATEGLALHGAKPGHYVVEVTRMSGTGPVRGEVKLSVAGKVQSIPFELVGDRLRVATAQISMRSKLVPLR
jgi:hypothetical protein